MRDISYSVSSTGLNVMTHDDQFSAAMSHSLGGMLNGGFSSALQEAFRPLLEEAFRRGVRVGAEMSKRAIDAALLGYEPQAKGDALAEAGNSTAISTPPSSGRRATPGTVRQIVKLVLQDTPGARVIEIQNTAKTLDASISPSSVSNELNRHKGTRYRQEGRQWFMIGETELAKPQADSLSYGAESAAGGDDRAAA